VSARTRVPRDAGCERAGHLARSVPSATVRFYGTTVLFTNAIPPGPQRVVT
jgi:hypothetical protein